MEQDHTISSFVDGSREGTYWDIRSDATDGRTAAKARGVAFGRPSKPRPDQRELARELIRDGKPISAVAKTFNVHPATIYRVIEG